MYMHVFMVQCTDFITISCLQPTTTSATVMIIILGIPNVIVSPQGQWGDIIYQYFGYLENVDVYIVPCDRKHYHTFH